MNWLRVAVVAFLTCVTCSAQGQLYFANRVGNGGSLLNSPVVLGSNPQIGPGPEFSVELVLLGPNGSLTPLAPVSTFNAPGTRTIESQFWMPKTVTVPGHFAGENLKFIVRAWQTSRGTYEAAQSSGGGYGQSDPFSAVLGGAYQDINIPPATPAFLTSLKPFWVGSITAPEPSIITIGILGAAALVILRGCK